MTPLTVGKKQECNCIDNNKLTEGVSRFVTRARNSWPVLLHPLSAKCILCVIVFPLLSVLCSVSQVY